MEWVETTGKTIDDAKDVALDQLGVDEADAEFEIIEEPRSGLFGLRKGEARIRARVRPTAPRSKDQHPRRKRKERGESGSKPNTPRAEATTDTSNTTEERPARQPKKKPAKPAGESKPKQSASNNEGGSATDEHVELAEQGETAKTFLSGFLGSIDITADIAVEINETDELVHVAVEGEQLGHLIGPRGTALHALQEVTRTVVQRQTGARNGRIILDISQYREKRRIALERFTRQIAEEVVANGVTRTLEPMHPSDRKVVHDTINEIDGVESSSEGEEPRRRVIIRVS